METKEKINWELTWEVPKFDEQVKDGHHWSFYGIFTAWINKEKSVQPIVSNKRMFKFYYTKTDEKVYFENLADGITEIISDGEQGPAKRKGNEIFGQYAFIDIISIIVATALLTLLVFFLSVAMFT